jgi:hypothetical protein
MQTRSSGYVLMVLLLLLLGSRAADAGVLLASARTASPFSFTYSPGGSSTVPVALNDAGSTSLTFTAPAAQTVVVTFSGECSGNTAGTRVIAVVLIDGVLANGDAAGHYTRVCAGGAPQTVMTRTVYKAVAAGSHTIQVVAWIDGPAFGFYGGTFENTVLTVTN